MAGAGLVYASGLDAAELNPANLARSAGWHVAVVELGTSGLFTGTTLADFQAIMGAGGDANTDAVAALGRLPDDGFSIEAAVEGVTLASVAGAVGVPRPGSPYPTVGVAVGPYALRIRSQVLTTGNVSRELADLAVNGFEEERLQEYAVRNTAFRVASFSEITFAYGYQLDRLAFGAAIRRVQGHRLTQIRLFEPEIDLNAQTMSLSGVAVESPGGSGFGIDLGVTLDLGPGLRWSMAIENATQRMTWDEDLRVHEATYTDDDFDAADFGDLVDRFRASSLDPSSVSLPVYETAQGLLEDAYFPTFVRAGVGWADSGTHVELVATAVAPKGRQRSSWDQRLSLGLEQRLRVVTLRGGYARGEAGLRAIAAGVGFGPWGPVEVEAGIGSISGTGPGDVPYDGVHGSLGISVRRGGS